MALLLQATLAEALYHVASTFKITALVRSKDKAEKLNTLGIESIIGSYTEDLKLLTDASSQADVVFTIVGNISTP